MACFSMSASSLGRRSTLYVGSVVGMHPCSVLSLAALWAAKWPGILNRAPIHLRWIPSPWSFKSSIADRILPHMSLCWLFESPYDRRRKLSLLSVKMNVGICTRTLRCVRVVYPTAKQMAWSSDPRIVPSCACPIVWASTTFILFHAQDSSSTTADLKSPFLADPSVNRILLGFDSTLRYSRYAASSLSWLARCLQSSHTLSFQTQTLPCHGL